MLQLFSIGLEVERTLLWIVLLPLMGALINGVSGRRASRTLVTAVAVGSVATAFLLAVAAFLHLAFRSPEGNAITLDVYEWFHIWVGDAEVPIRVRFTMDHLSGVMTVMVTGIASLIHIYSVGYMGEDPGYSRFMTYLNLFTASMLVLVLASNFPLMFVGWEGVGLCSYLLIGFWYTNADYAAAGRKAFVVNRIGDFGVLVGMFLLLAALAFSGHSDGFEFSVINEYAVNLGTTPAVLIGQPLGLSVATLAVLFIFLGCTGKSAQIPLFVWLPDAMAGPTPVSALIHAATMVTAGVYLCCRISPVIVESPVAMSVIALVGSATALVAASIALVQNQMKKILAYSTVSQLGFMFAAVGSGAFGGALFHVFTHAFFKACLFLGAGSVMHAVHAHGDADIRYLGGLRRIMPTTHWTFLVSCGAIAGLPPLAGFFSKDELLLGAATWGVAAAESERFAHLAWVGWATFIALALAATMTAFYMFRLYFRSFHGDFKGGHPPAEHGDDDHAPVHPHESPTSMTLPLSVLAIGAAVVGFLGMPHSWGVPNLWSRWLTPRYEAFLEALHHAPHGEGHGGHEEVVAGAMAAARSVTHGLASLQFDGRLAHGPGWVAFLAMGAGLLAGVGGTLLAYVWYAQQNGETPASIRGALPALHRFLMDKWRFDELYAALIVRPMVWLGVLSANLDRVLVDGVLTRVSSAAMRAIGYAITRLQTGVVFSYAAMLVLGMVVLVWWFVYPHPSLTAEPSASGLTWRAAEGYAYAYRWDFDSDGEWDSDWSPEREATARYDGTAYYALVAVIRSPRDKFGPTELVLRQHDAPVPIHEVSVDRNWEGPTAPTVQYDRGALRLQINDASIPDRDGEEDGVLTLAPGRTLRFHGLTLNVAVAVRGTVEVRNAFGYTARAVKEATLQVGARGLGAGARSQAARSLRETGSRSAASREARRTAQVDLNLRTGKEILR